MRRLLWKRDASEPAIVEALEKAGWTVCRVNGTPGSPDLIATKHGRVIAGEVKTGKGSLTKHQGKWPVWRSAAEALEATR